MPTAHPLAANCAAASAVDEPRSRVFVPRCKRRGRDPKEIALACRVLSGPGVRPRGSIEGEAELFTGGDSGRVGDVRRLQDPGVTSVDVRLFGHGEARTLRDTIDDMHRFRDGVPSRLA